MNDMQIFSTGTSLLTRFFETLEKQMCKQKTVSLEECFSTKWKNENTKLYCAI